jgi:hypothetical protein
MNGTQFDELPPAHVVDEMWSAIASHIRPDHRRRRHNTVIAMVAGFALAGSGAAAFAVGGHLYTAPDVSKPTTTAIHPLHVATAREIEATDPASEFQTYASSIGALGVWVTAGTQLHVRMPAGVAASAAQIERLKSYGLPFDFYASAHTSADVSALRNVFSGVYARDDGSSFSFGYDARTDVLEFQSSYSGQEARALAKQMPAGAILTEFGTIDWDVAQGRIPGAAQHAARDANSGPKALRAP